MKPTKNRFFCNDCGKIIMLFETEKKAEYFIKFNKDEIEEETGYKPERTYFCIACNGWHITSQKDDLHKKSRTEKVEDLYHKSIEHKALIAAQKQELINAKKREKNAEKDLAAAQWKERILLAKKQEKELIKIKRAEQKAVIDAQRKEQKAIIDAQKKEQKRIIQQQKEQESLQFTQENKKFKKSIGKIHFLFFIISEIQKNKENKPITKISKQCLKIIKQAFKELENAKSLQGFNKKNELKIKKVEEKLNFLKSEFITLLNEEAK